MDEETKMREKPRKPVLSSRFFQRKGKPFLTVERIGHFVEIIGGEVTEIEEDDEKIIVTITIPKTLT